MRKIEKLLETFKYWEALEILEKEIKNGSENCEYYLEAGHIYRGVGEMYKALSFYENAVKKGCKEAGDYLEITKKLLENM